MKTEAEAQTDAAFIGSRIDAINAERDQAVAERNALRMRVSDLKLALGNDAGWFDRCRRAEADRDKLRAEVEALRELEDAFREWTGRPQWNSRPEGIGKAKLTMTQVLEKLDALRAGGSAGGKEPGDG